jgi:hypothetical protein
LAPAETPAQDVALVAPPPAAIPSGLPARDDRLSAEKVARHHGFELQPLFSNGGEDLRNVDALHEAHAQNNLVNPLAKTSEFNPLLLRLIRDLLCRDRKEDHSFVQDLIVLQVVEEGGGSTMHVTVHEYRRSPYPLGGILHHIVDEEFARERTRLEAFRENAPSRLPGRKKSEDKCTNHEGEPPSAGDLQKIGTPEGEVDYEE